MDPITQNPLGYSVIHEYDKSITKQEPKPKLSNLLRKKQSRYWIPDETVTHCTGCGVAFSMWIRYHHCRSCFGVFCWECTPHRRVIPKTLRGEIPTTINETVNRALDKMMGSLESSWNGILSEDYNQKNDKHSLMSKLKPNNKEDYPQRLCHTCNDQVDILIQLDALIRVFTIVMPDLDMLNRMASVCQMWNNLVQYFKGKIRNMQYRRIDKGFSSFEKKLLWTNRRFWIGHSHYTLLLIRSLDFQSYEYATLQHSDFCNFLNSVENYTEHISNRDKQTYNCIDLMCTRNCCPKLRAYHAIILIHLSRKLHVCDQLSNMILRMLTRINAIEIELLLPFLVERLADHRVDSSHSWGNFLINRSVSDPKLALEFYWNLVYLERTTRHAAYRYYLNSLMNYLNPLAVKTINSSFKLVRILENLPGAQALRRSGEHISMAGGGVGPGYGGDLYELKSYLRNQNFKDLVIPYDSTSKVKNLIVHQVSVKNSYTAPVLLPFECCKSTLDNQNITHRVLYKFEGVRTDYIVIRVIRLMAYLLEKYEGITLETVDYNVVPLSKDAGLIQVVPDCSTAYEIKERMKFSIWNYIVENNPTRTVEELRQKFVKSCATYCILTYLLGVGDRHLDNIMITKDGRLFHIDYGFILGADPKPITQPKIRITPDMVDALGGYNSQYYLEFLELCNRIYQGLRGHLNIIISMLSLLADGGDGYENLVSLLSNRFMMGETQKNAVIQLESEIMRSSTRQNFGEQIVDLFHYHNKEKTLQNAVSGAVSGAETVVKGAAKIGRRTGSYLLSKTGWY